MVTDLVQIRLRAAEKADENLAFRRYLHAHHGLDDSFHATAHEVAAHIDCTQCANCCRETRVNVSPREMEAIAQYLGEPLDDVLRHYTEIDPRDHQRQLRQPDGSCVFLDGNLCMVYEARPRACREFPYAEATETSLGSRQASIWARAWLCPIVFNAIESHKKKVGFPKAHHAAPGS